ncbi:hypothetical protein pipiens_003328 [Culex pipiens pipiens]|uniref:Uncharacterized protein n=1 Tax=Culex pipiens pipiens TaxID=38569 RepID=A0ABD1D2V5_CULPP
MFHFKTTVVFVLLAALCCHAKFTNRQLKILHNYIDGCASDLGIKDFDKLELLAVAGRQTAPSENFVKILHCLFMSADFVGCDGTVQGDNFAAFIADGHNNMDQLPAALKSCVDGLKGTPEQRSFQLYRCMFGQHKFEM